MDRKNMRPTSPLGPRDPETPPRLPSMWTWIIIAVGFYFVFKMFMGSGTSPALVAELEKAVRSNQVQVLEFYPESLRIVATLTAKESEQPKQMQVRATSSEHMDAIRQLAEKRGIKYIVKDPPADWSSIIWLIVPLIFLFFIFRMMTGGGGVGGGISGAASFTKNPGQWFKPNASNRTTFKDVAGCDEAKEELWEVIEFLKNPAEFTRLGARIPKGVLMHGEPGTGKTLLARAVAGEANAPFLFVSGAGFIEMFVGVGASRVRSLFAEAKKNAPCILFIDEIDAIGKKRGKAIGGGHDEREQALNELLREMDGFVGDTRVVVIAATNRIDVLDDALLRPGRFDRQVYVSKPDMIGREAILKVHSRNKKLNADVDLRDIAKDTVGMAGAELENVMNEAAMLATRRGKKAIERVDLTDAVDKVTMGPEKKSTKLSEEEKKTVAYHEAGHALVAALTKEADPVYKVTIIPRGPALGYVRQLPEEDRHLASKGRLLAQVSVCLGGRASEELILRDVSSGAANDLERANYVLRRMICELGMSDKVGLAVYKGGVDFWGQSTGVDASPKTKELLDQEVKAALDRSYKYVSELLGENKAKLEALANALLEKETLTAEEVKQIIKSAS